MVARPMHPRDTGNATLGRGGSQVSTVIGIWLWHGLGMLLVILEVSRQLLCGRVLAVGFVAVDLGRAGVERVGLCWCRQR